MNLASLSFLSLESVIYIANIAIASVVACGAAWLVLRICSTASLPLRHAVLVASLIACLASPIFLALPHAKFSPLALTVRDNLTVSGELQSVMSQDARRPPVAHSVELGRTEPVAALDRGNTLAANSTDVEAPAAPRIEPVLVPPSPSHRSWLDAIRLLGCVLALVWLTGGIWNSCRLARGCIQLRRLIKSLKPLANPEIEATAREAALQLGQHRVPKIRQSDMVHGPLSIGPFRPLVVVPTSIRGLLTDVQLRGMLLHEFAHIARRDHLVGLLQRLAMIIFWWNPLVHRVSERISSIREQICDDLATSRIESPDSYADMLLELAERVGVLSLPATIGIFENPGREFRTRIVRLLDSRRPIVTTLDRRMKFFCGLLFATIISVILGTAIHVKTADAAVQADDWFVQPPQTSASKTNASSNPVTAKPKNGAADNAAGPPIKWPAVLYGTIKSPDGKPITGAKVRIDVEKIHQYPLGRWEENIHTARLASGVNGEYRFDIPKLPETTHRPICVKITCTFDGYADAKTWTWYNHKDKSVGEHFRDLKMKPGRTIRGRVVDREGIPMAGAVIKVAGDNGPDNWQWDPSVTGGDGKFEIRVPKDSTRAFELWVAHPNRAPQHASIPKDGNELADIRLQDGTPVTGSVFRADGKPAAGAVVAAESVFEGNLKSVAFPVRIAVKTDSNGHYELPPLAGIYKIWLAQAAENDERVNDRFIVADEPPPIVLPQKLSASGLEPQTINFHAGPTLTVRGTIRWADGRPVPRTEAWASYLPENSIGVELGRMDTDDQGNYEFQVPRPIDSLYITGMGAFDKNKKWCFAYGDAKVPVKQQGIQFIRLDELKSDVDGLDFVVRPEAKTDTVRTK